MMQLPNVFTIILVAFVFSSCSTENSADNQDEQALNQIDSLLCLQELTGNYIGQFGSSSIRIEISYANEQKVIGYNILRGLQRNLSGNVIHEKDGIQLVLNEPGDHENDGKFVLSLHPETCEISGEWHSNSGKVPSRKFRLTKVVQNQEYEPPYTLENLTNAFGFLTSEYGDLEFQNNGRVVFSFFEERDVVAHEEKTIYYGNWSMDTDKILIEWQKNTIFEKEKMRFSIDDSEGLRIVHDTLVFYSRIY